MLYARLKCISYNVTSKPHKLNKLVKFKLAILNGVPILNETNKNCLH